MSRPVQRLCCAGVFRTMAYAWWICMGSRSAMEPSSYTTTGCVCVQKGGSLDAIRLRWLLQESYSALAFRLSHMRVKNRDRQMPNRISSRCRPSWGRDTGWKG